MPTTGPSLHLFWSELACKDGTPYPTLWRQTRAVTLADGFERFRHLCGDRELTVDSGFRTSEWNRVVKGAKTSQHIEGRAIDILKPGHLILEQFWALAHAFALERDNAVRGLGYYPWGVHLDDRPSNRVVVWYGTRPNADVSDSE